MQPPTDTVVLGNTNAKLFSMFSGDVFRCLRSLAERSQVSPRGSPNRNFLAPAGTGAGEKPPKTYKSGKAREPTGGHPGGGRGGRGGQPAGETGDSAEIRKILKSLKTLGFYTFHRK